jgi:hypothetical protein
VYRWIEFNDSTVRPFDERYLPHEAWGGHERPLASSNSQFRRKLIEKSKSAYLLIYERRVQTPVTLSRFVAPQGAADAAAPTAASAASAASAATPSSAAVAPTPTASAASAASASASAASAAAPAPAPATVVTTVLSGTSVVSTGAAGSGADSKQLHQMPPKIYESVWKENTAFLKNRDVFEAEYLNFLAALIWRGTSVSSASASGAASAHALSPASSSSSSVAVLPSSGSGSAGQVVAAVGGGEVCIPTGACRALRWRARTEYTPELWEEQKTGLLLGAGAAGAPVAAASKPAAAAAAAAAASASAAAAAPASAPAPATASAATATAVAAAPASAAPAPAAVPVLPPAVDNSDETVTLNVATRFALEILAHAKQSTAASATASSASDVKLKEWVKCLCDAYRTNVPACYKLLDSLAADPPLLKQLLIECNQSATRTAVCELLVVALTVLSPFEGKLYPNTIERVVMPGVRLISPRFMCCCVGVSMSDLCLHPPAWLCSV